MTSFREASLRTIRAAMARAVLDAPDSIPARLGSIALRDHQSRAAARLASIISRQGGAMLAEPVGLGKTYTAIAVAAHLGGDLLVVAPAALRRMWECALGDCRIAGSIVTHEALSRGARPDCAPSFVIVDEAHRFRSTCARRYDAAAEICRRAQVLLVTATPVQNRRDDLAAQLALFLGRRAWLLTDQEQSRFVVRGDAVEPAALPRLSGPHARRLRSQDDCLDDLLALPPPVPARDGSVAAALLAFGLVHQWTSSRAALVAALKRRRMRGAALASALESGRRPTRRELSAWTQGDDAVQLAFPELVTDDSAAPDDGATAAELLGSITNHNRAIESLLERLRGTPDPDEERAAALREICAAHPGERVIAFCQYAETVNSLRARLSDFPGVAALTAAGARIASGRVSRDTVLAQFIPSESRVRPTRRVERVDLLLATDLLSEGLNLQEASVIVHLDLPWNPARLDQRVGRVRRLGSRFDRVAVYAITPPAPANELLRLEERLREKIRLAQRTVGIAGRILPTVTVAPVSTPEDHSLAESEAVVRKRLETWRVDDGLGVAEQPPHGRAIVAAVVAPRAGFLAMVRHTDGVRLVASLGSAPERSPDVLAGAVEIARGPEAAIEPRAVRSAVEQLDRWLAAEHAASMIDIRAATASRARRHALSRVSEALARAPRHRRALLAPLASAARAVAVAPLAEGAERILDMLVSAELPDEAWLRSIAAFGEMNVRPSPAAAAAGTSSILAMIVFAPR